MTVNSKTDLNSNNSQIPWINYLKSIAILLIVYYHVIIKHLLKDFYFEDKSIKSVLKFSFEIYIDFTMPIFFAISGFLATKYLNSEWKNVLKNRIFKFYYIYFIWLLILTFIHYFFTPDFSTVIPREINQIPSYAIYKPSNLWCLYALSVYFLVAKLFHNVWVVNFLIGIFLTFFGDFLLPAKLGHMSGVLENFIWFSVGAYFLRWFLDKASKNLFLSFALLVSICIFNVSFNLEIFEIKLTAQLNKLLMMLISILITKNLLKVMGGKFSNRNLISRDTLMIYIFHWPLLGLIQRIVKESGVNLEFNSATDAIIYAIFISLILTLGSIQIGKFIKKYFPFLFDFPKVIKQKMWLLN